MGNRRTVEELGSILTREIMTMLQDGSLTKEQRFDVLTAVMFDTTPKNTILASYANALKSGWNKVNSDRIEQIERGRETRKEYMKRVRKDERVYIHGDTQGRVYIRDDINNINNINNIPLNPPRGIAGGEAKDSAVSVGVGEGNELAAGAARGGEVEAPGGAGAARLEPGADGAGLAELPTIREAAMELADRVEASEAFGHMRSNRGKLVKSICSVLKKNGGAETAAATGGKMLAGLEAWTAAWKAEGWQYAPGRIVDWILDEKWLEPVRERGGGGVASGQDYGEVGVKEIV